MNLKSRLIIATLWGFLLVNLPAKASDSLYKLLESKEWLEFKEVLLAEDFLVTDVGGVDGYCKQYHDAYISEIAPDDLFPGCAEAALSALGSLSSVITIPQDNESKRVKPINFSETIDVRTVAPGSLYIRLKTLENNAHLKILEQIRSLEVENKPRYKNVILDLRGNIGGSLGGLATHAGVFFGEGKKIVKVIGKNKKVQQEIKTSLAVASYLFPYKTIVAPKLNSNMQRAKYVVIVDRDTVLGAEALAALMQQKGGKILGEKSAGLTTTYSVKNIDGLYLKIHSGNIYTMNGKNWSGVGVFPDIAVDEHRVAPEQIGDLQADLWLQIALKQLAGKK